MDILQQAENILRNYSTEQLSEMRTKYAKVPSIVSTIDEELTRRKDSEVEATASFEAMARDEEAKAKFGEALEKMVSKLPPPPAGVLNTLLKYAEVEVADTAKPMEDVIIIDTQAVMGVDGKITTPAISHVEKRHPLIKVKKWVSDVNHACVAGKGLAPNRDGKRKLAITLRQVTGDKVSTIGNFRSGAEACKHLNIDAGAGSANLALNKSGYVISSYFGTDFEVRT